MRTPTRVIFAVLAKAASLSSVEVRGQDAGSIMQDIMRERTTTQCRKLGPAFIMSRTGFHDPYVRGLAASCFTAKARLHLFGEYQQLIMNGARVGELPIRTIAEQTGLNLDPYHPLAGKSLRE